MKKMKIEIVSSETIKPSSPTPINLRSFKLSVMDQLAVPVYAPVAFFYQAAPAEASEKLKKSLSETLTHFYPLAGRINDSITVIECNDDGAVYVEARVHGVLLSDLLQQPDWRRLNQFIPVDPNSPESVAWPLLVVQASFFECGGLVVGLCMSHKFGDGTVGSTFTRAWAAITHNGDDKLTPSLLPQLDTTAFRYLNNVRRDDDISIQKAQLGMLEEYDKVDDNHVIAKRSVFVTKRFVIDASKVAALKAKAASETVERPTRFEAVAGLIWRCVIAASTRSNPELRYHMLEFPVNLRKMVEPPLPENSIGNLISGTIVESYKGDSNYTIKDLAAELRKGIKEFCESKATKFGSRDPDDAFEVVFQHLKELAYFNRSKKINILSLTSWINFKLYEVDFGWNKPIWVSIADEPQLNLVRLLETRDGGGVETWVSLTEQQMALFECDPQLLQYASLNPSV